MTAQQPGPAAQPPDPTRGVYGISVAADLVGLGPQTLRMYERKGLLEPDRTPAGTRLYSEQDLARLRRITELLAAGLNLAGAARVMDLEDDNALLRAAVQALELDEGRPPAGPDLS